MVMCTTALGTLTPLINHWDDNMHHIKRILAIASLVLLISAGGTLAFQHRTLQATAAPCGVSVTCPDGSRLTCTGKDECYGIPDVGVLCDGVDEYCDRDDS